MEKLSQHLNFRDSDQHSWNTIEAGNEVQADSQSQDATEDFYDQPKHMFFYNAEFFEGMQKLHVKVIKSDNTNEFYNLLTSTSNSARIILTSIDY